MGGFLYRLSHVVCNAACSVYFRHRGAGTENIPEGGFLLAVNHTSFLDPVLAGIKVKRPMYFIARRTLFRPAPIGWFLRSINAVPVDRGRLTRDTYREVLDLLGRGEGVLIFPEGTRSADGALGRLKGGVVRLAQLAEVPVVPTYLHNAHRALGRGKIFPRPVRTSVRFGAPLQIGADDDRTETLKLIEERLVALREQEENVRELAPAG